MKLAIIAAAALSLGLGGCALNKIDLPATINALAAAGCKGTISNSVTATTAAGLSPGSASVTHTFTGSCDPANAHAAGAIAPGALVGPQ